MKDCVKLSSSILKEIWSQPIRRRVKAIEAKTFAWLFVSLFALACVLAVVGFLIDPISPGLLGFRIGFWLLLGVCFVAFYFWYIFLVISIGQQFSPANARLVPHLERNMIWALAIPIVFASVCASVFYGMATQAFSLVPAIIAIVLGLGMATAVRNQWMFIVFIFSLQIPSLLMKRGVIGEQWMAQVDGAWAPLWIIILLALVFFVLHRLVSMKEEALFSAYAYHQRAKTMLESGVMNSARFKAFYAWGLQAWMVHTLAKATRLDTHLRFSLCVYSLGSSAHCSHLFLRLISIFIFTLSLGLVTSVFGGTLKTIEQLAGSYVFMLLLLPVAYAFFTIQALYRTRVEQGLMMLTPNSGTQAEVTGVLQRYLLRQFLFVVAGTGMVAVLAALTIKVRLEFLIWFGCVLLLSLWFALSLVNDYSTMRFEKDHALIAYLVAFAVMMILVAIGIATLPKLMLTVVCGSMALFALFFVQRSLRKNRGQILFPVGRRS